MFKCPLVLFVLTTVFASLPAPTGACTPGDVCRAAAGVCDVDEICDAGGNCPADAFQPATTVCRPPAGACDLEETCTGSSADCPPDQKSTAVCRPSAGPCDVAESCDDVSDNCPSDGFQPSGTPCPGGTCDGAGNCTAATTTTTTISTSTTTTLVQSKCTAAKIKAAGKKAACKTGVDARGDAKNLPPDTVHLGGCTDKFTAAFAKAETAGACIAPNGDQSTIETKVDAFVNDVQTEIATGNLGTAGSKCVATKVKAAGNKASCKLGVYAKAASKNLPVDTAKLAGCDAKWEAAAVKADAAGDCGTMPSNGLIESDVDNFVNDVKTELTRPLVIVRPSNGGTIGDVADLVAAINDDALFQSLFSYCSGGSEDGIECANDADCMPPGTCAPPVNVVHFEVSDDGGANWHEFYERGVADPGPDFVATSIHPPDASMTLRLRVRLGPTNDSSVTLFVDQIEVVRGLPGKPAPQGPCGCSKMTIATAGTSTLAMWWMPEGMEDALGAYNPSVKDGHNAIDLTKPGPYTIRFNFEIQADLTADTSDPMDCVEGQEVATTATSGNGKPPAKIVEAYKLACTAGLVDINKGAICEKSANCDTHHCSVNTAAGCDLAGDVLACVTSNGECVSNHDGICERFKFVDRPKRGNDDYIEPETGDEPVKVHRKDQTPKSINWIDGPGLPDLPRERLESGGATFQGDFHAFVKGTAGEPSCDCTYVVEFNVDAQGNVLIPPRIQPGSLLCNTTPGGTSTSTTTTSNTTTT